MYNTSVARPRPPAPRAPVSPTRTLRNRTAHVAPETGPFDQFATCDGVLVIADIENWAYGARDLGLEIDFAELSRLLKAKLRRASLHAFFSAPDGDSVIAQHLARLGWNPHSRAIIDRPGTAHTTAANADLAIAFGTAKLLGHTQADGILLGTGDGVLALDCARAIRSAFRKCGTVGTLSLAGSTSRLLDARTAREINVNVEVGRDVMRQRSA